MRKFLPYIVILIILAGLFIPVIDVQAQETITCYVMDQVSGETIQGSGTEAWCREIGGSLIPPSSRALGTCTDVNGGKSWDVPKESCLLPEVWTPNSEILQDAGTSGADTKTTYNLLAPLPGIDTTIDTQKSDENPCAFGKYMNSVISLIIGLIAIAAVVMIVLGGLQYMTSELISSKEAGKDRIRNALLGLLIALGAYVLLFTINEKLVDMCLDLPEVKITVMGPDAGDDTIDPDFAKGIRKYYTDNAISPEVSTAVTKLEQGWEISQFHVFKNNRMLIGLKKGSEIDNSTIISITPGLGGYAPIGTGKQGDKKTPSGSWKIIEIRHTPGEAQFNDKGSNMGAAFWRLDPMTSGERGIGMHGNKRGTLGATNGCIRLKNADILALQKYVKVGIPVFIDN